MRLAFTLVAVSLLGSAVVANDDPSPAALKSAVKNGARSAREDEPDIRQERRLQLVSQPDAAGRRAGIRARPRRSQPARRSRSCRPKSSEATAERYVEYSIGGGAGITALGFELFAAAIDHKPADARIRAKLYFIKGMQQPEGHWVGGGSRPPLTFDDFTTTAYMIHALRTYAAPAEAADTNARIDRARSWLLSNGPIAPRSGLSRPLVSPGRMQTRRPSPRPSRACRRRRGPMAAGRSSPLSSRTRTQPASPSLRCTRHGCRRRIRRTAPG